MSRQNAWAAVCRGQYMSSHVAGTDNVTAMMYPWSKEKGKFGAYAMKRVATGAHLPTSRLLETAKGPYDTAWSSRCNSDKKARYRGTTIKLYCQNSGTKLCRRQLDIIIPS